ncbi:cytosine/adenosine deaminase-related metal-dependent hydrolase [Pararhizobium capsulatum DSM 1112]|uniref:Cytosine/adenosine deaminase-related metal-dependent hydrolase n=1 Tax=Pararhizobium capsulatum DSM 1112 TaxID=1121113 RepID=A0ABU0C056_9HYPH|nr:amidohydrolase family protein [Pararhizobium capsulatum]MDQ0323884.1 cytosine/adenosine deaminase-related metal-dependent hydrolase [Pararhizobium capsulatum DSM 1112]
MSQASIVRASHLYSAPGLDGRWRPLESGAIYQRGGIVEEIGTYDAIREAHPDAPLFGSERSVVLPGFVNGHHHVGLTPTQLGSPDLPLELWLIHRLRARYVDPYLDTVYSAFEMLASGVTAVQHIRAGTIGSIQQSEASAREIIRAYQDIGMRVSLSFSVRDQNRLVYGDDAAFVASLPEELRSKANWHLSRFEGSVDEYIALFQRLRVDYADDSLVGIQLAPANLHWCSDKTLRKFADVSERHDAPIHIHLLETQYQKAYGFKRAGRSAFEHIASLGIVGPRVTIGHGVWATESDLDMVADTGTHICHNCSSNFRLRSGVAPVNQFRSRGINVALGMDEAGINDNRDMLQEMRLVLNAHRQPGMDLADVPSTNEVLTMATLGGARTTPFGEKIGSLRVGCRADLVMFDLDKISYPYLDGNTSVLDAVMHRATPQDIHGVMVDGEIVYRDGQFTRVDHRALLENLSEHMRRPLTEAEQSGKWLGNALLPYAREFYRS